MTQIKKNTPTLLHYPERSIFMKEVNTQNLWTFELGTQEGINVPIWIFVAFQQNDRQNDQNLKNETFFRPLVTSAQCITGTEKYPDCGILLNYNDDDYSQGYGQIKEASKTLTKDNLLQHLYQNMILDRLMKVIILVIIYRLSIYDVKKILKILSQLKLNLNLME